MLHYIVIANLHDHATDDQVTAAVEGYVTLASAIPQMRSVAAGRDVGPGSAAPKMLFTAQFASAADYEVYRSHPVPAAFATERVLPISDISVATYFDDGRPAE